ncbi:MAG: GNAT family N-acetyltransferase [Rhodoferax sp.]
MQLVWSPNLDQTLPLLELCGLPIVDLTAQHGVQFVVAQQGALTVGVAGLQCLGACALVRSVAVHPQHRRAGLGQQLLSAVEGRARGLGVQRLFLLTESAQAFFRRQGYAELPRCAAPPELQACSQWGLQRCAGAAAMEKVLG